jgi:Ca2+-dependent lipid-binding protein
MMNNFYVQVAELVDVSSGQPINGMWRHRTLTKRRCLEPTWDETVKWRDVFVPFESLALRVRVFDDDTFSADDPLGEVREKIMKKKENNKMQASQRFFLPTLNVFERYISSSF